MSTDLYAMSRGRPEPLAPPARSVLDRRRAQSVVITTLIVASALAGCSSSSGRESVPSGSGAAAGSGGSAGSANSGGAAGAAGQSASAGNGGAAGGDSGGIGGSASAPADACGPGPYVKLTGVITSYTNPDTKIASVQITADLCPGSTFLTDANGYTEVMMTKGASYDLRAEATGYLTERTGEQILQADFDAGAPMIPNALKFLFSHWSADTPTILAVVAFTADTAPTPDPNDPCTTKDGATFQVTGHPEAVVTYYGGTNAPNEDPTLTATGVLGLAEISGLVATAPGDVVELTVQKAGCEVSFDSYPHTGKYILENGVLTLAGAFLPPLTGP